MGRRRRKRNKKGFKTIAKQVFNHPTNKSTAITVVKNTSVTKTETKDTNTTPTTKTTGISFYSNKKNYDYKGRKNKTEYPKFTNLCMYSQSGLKYLLETKLIEAGYTEVISEDGYLYAKGTVPVLLTAHMDTVHKESVRNFYEYYDEEKNQHIISSPQGIGGDDRCGIYMILEIIKTHKCSVLFCEDEESGCIGSSKFCETDLINELSELNYLIELDRMNAKDAVFYNCANDEFTQFILDNTGYEEEWGSCSDISELSPACGVASVNFSCGYYNAHTTSEYVIVEEMLNTIEMVKKLLEVECGQFEYIEGDDGFYYGYGYGYSKRNSRGYGCYNSYDYYEDNFGYGTYKNANKTSKDLIKSDSNKLSKAKKKEIAFGYAEEFSVIIHVYDSDSEEILEFVYNGITADEAFGKFFREYAYYSFNDVYDYEICDSKICENGLINCQ